MSAVSFSIRARINRLRRQLWRLLFGRMLHGDQSQGELRPATRLSPTVLIEHEDRLQLGDDVFIAPFVFIEASSGIRIGDGVQIASFVSIVSHSTHRSVRLAKALSGTAMEEALAPSVGRAGDVRESIAVGAHSFIGPHTTLEAGTRLGVGCLVASHCRVRGEVPDFAIVAGSPARVVGDVREGDAHWLAQRAQAHGIDGAVLHGAYRQWCERIQGIQAAGAPSDAAAGMVQGTAPYTSQADSGLPREGKR